MPLLLLLLLLHTLCRASLRRAFVDRAAVRRRRAVASLDLRPLRARSFKTWESGDVLFIIHFVHQQKWQNDRISPLL